MLSWLFRRSRRSIPEFWEWFAQNEDRLAKGVQDPPALIAEIGAALRRSSPKLVAEFSTIETDGRFDLVISADGNRKHITEVRRVVAAAPALRRWRAVAFRQRSSGITLQIGDVTLDPETLECGLGAPAQLDGSLLLIVYAPSDDMGLVRAIQAPIGLLLDSLLGELDTMTKIGAVEVVPSSVNVDKVLEPGFQRFRMSALPAKFDRLWARTAAARPSAR